MAETEPRSAAPAAGPTPDEVNEIRPAVAFGCGTDEAVGPRTTGWTF